jgi:hypothetical protein
MAWQHNVDARVYGGTRGEVPSHHAHQGDVHVMLRWWIEDL